MHHNDLHRHLSRHTLETVGCAMGLRAAKLLRFMFQETFILMSGKEKVKKKKLNNNYATLEVDEFFKMISLREHRQVTCTHSMIRELGFDEMTFERLKDKKMNGS